VLAEPIKTVPVHIDETWEKMNVFRRRLRGRSLSLTT
jgi:hypothetical protein